MSKNSNNPPNALEFKSSTFSVPILVLYSNDPVSLEQQLQQKIQLAPDFFKNSPVVFDLQEINEEELEIEIAPLVDMIRRAGLLPIGIRGGNEKQIEAALSLNIPTFSIHHSLFATQKKSGSISPSAQETIATPKIESSTLITQPIRSGQRVYASGDLIVLAQVSAGSEIFAEGNIHVYNTLRGRALAGVQGNTEARIFCFDLQAELISIAGHYKTSEDLDKSIHNKPVQIYLNEHSLIIKEFVKSNA
jgi:septum site-determining protein MinC